MIFKELAEQTLKEYPDGIWVHFHNLHEEYSERYLDEYYMESEEFDDVLDKEVKKYYIDDCDYDVLEIF